ncbi:enoyl-CoA hydratase [Virgibacillus profundi]|uniref:Enoyl-CoA hydratase n=1 Tax=Virgibacillus profundi TaxID=2024555 RepID=A0A2A2ICD7_9BACI|nr:enoyl-CoA hydratase [Virgibacillus profundi]PAV29399.1 enoyl-CoA hydratase [Virgibacillus profundi]PXY53569.1 enoyl-CoA hydratase [Virgibacillus profundi]
MTLVNLEITDEHIAIISLNRPEAANAMSHDLLMELNEIIQKVDQDPSIYCSIITGTNEKAFCAGADLKERKGMTDEQVVSAVRYIGDTVNAVENMHMPVIAALNGVAFGGGLELALACDLRIAAKHVKVGLTETSLAIIPGAGGTQRLTRLIGLGQAKRMIYTAKPIQAEEALNIGLVEQVVEADSLMDNAVQLAKTIAGNGPVALRQAKTAINKGIQTDITTGLSIEHLCYKETIPTHDRLEGLKAFKEKRKPLYTGK